MTILLIVWQNRKNYHTTLVGPRHAKTCLRAYADNEGPDHPRSLIRAFTVREYNQWILQNLWKENKAPDGMLRMRGMIWT